MAKYSSRYSKAWFIQQVGNIAKQLSFVVVLGYALGSCGQDVVDGKLPSAQLVAICASIIQVIGVGSYRFW